MLLRKARRLQRRQRPLRNNRGRARALAGAFALASALTACSDGGPNAPEPPAGGSIVEARALWVTRYDWASPAEINALIDSAASARFNIIYFQVRGNMDALYVSTLEPWALRHSAFQGNNPGWDPLAVALTRAQAKGLELHAWLNAFYVWPDLTMPRVTTPLHALIEHPEWFMVDAVGSPLYESGTTNRWASPARAGARSRLAAVAADVARRYAVDGVHLDFIRYPGTAAPDSASAAGAAAAGMGVDAYRRSMVTTAVRETRDSLSAARPNARLSVAAWGIYQPPAGWNTSSGYDQMMQDPREWTRSGLVDAIVPMVYWPIAATYGARTDFAYLADDHARAVNDRHVYIGITLEHMIAKGNLQTELPAEIERARAAGAEGVAVLSGRLLREQNAWRSLREGAFAKQAKPPPQSWRPN